MRFIVLGMALFLGGCLLTTRDPIGITQSELEAINARAECKQLARTLVQIARCDNR